MFYSFKTLTPMDIGVCSYYYHENFLGWDNSKRKPNKKNTASNDLYIWQSLLFEVSKY